VKTCGEKEWIVPGYKHRERDLNHLVYLQKKLENVLCMFILTRLSAVPKGKKVPKKFLKNDFLSFMLASWHSATASSSAREGECLDTWSIKYHHHYNALFGSQSVIVSLIM
jgi:hypothetical protein